MALFYLLSCLSSIVSGCGLCVNLYLDDLMFVFFNSLFVHWLSAWDFVYLVLVYGVLMHCNSQWESCFR